MRCVIGFLSAACAFGYVVQAASAATLLLHYNFDEASSGNLPALDNGLGIPASGLFMGGATRTSDTPAGLSLAAVDLTTPGGGTYVDGGDADKLDALSSFTLTAWIKLLDVPSGNLRIMSKQGGGAFPGFNWNISDPLSGVGTRTASNFGLRLFVGGTNGFVFDPVPTALSIDADGKWAFVAVSYDGDSGADNVNYYVGSPMAPATLQSTTTVAAGPVTDNTNKFGVGYTDAAPAADTAPPGFMDDIRVYSGILTQAEVEEVRRANVIPEPCHCALLSTGLVILVTRRRRALAKK
jgi:hypothetical protein